MTNDTLSSDVAASLRQRAALIDPAAAERIAKRAADARPRSHRRLALASSAASAAGIGGIVAAAVTLSGSTPAFASWTANPTKATAADATSATTACAKQLASMPGGSGRATWTPTATDVRGQYVLEELASGSLSATCLTGPNLTSVSLGSGGGSLSSTGTPSGDPGGTSATTNYASGDAITDLTLSSLNTHNGAPFAILEGTVTPGVTDVSLTLSDGQKVQATLKGGLLLAWWPNGSKPVTAAVTNASGTTTQSLGTFGPGPGATVHRTGRAPQPGK
ncbi:MAG: hypothetical protein J2P57_11435 [Acidimicrobiaceae bacterium]|nr:hypothetical protein [Acidimicrobiaceae bacterium]